MEDPIREERREMVSQQLVARGIRDERVLAAFERVPRHEFVPLRYRGSAHEDRPLPIGHGQTISQPYIVAYMLEALELQGTERVLDVGTGSGYQAALLGELAREVYSVEIVPELATTAAHLLRELGHTNVHVHLAEVELGWTPEAPYDAIAVAAATPRIPRALLEQLADPGRMIIPIGPAGEQSLTLIRREKGALQVFSLGGCSFVPLLGGELSGPSTSPELH